MEARLLTGRPGSYRGGAGGLGHSQGGWASHREAGPLTGRSGLSQ